MATTTAIGARRWATGTAAFHVVIVAIHVEAMSTTKPVCVVSGNEVLSADAALVVNVCVLSGACGNLYKTATASAA